MNKYRNIKVNYNGKIYDSKRESHRAFELDMLKRAGEISGYEAQVPLQITINGIKICKYVADFKVFYEGGKVEYEDVKSEHTRKLAVYRLKKKLVKAVLDIDIIEIL